MSLPKNPTNADIYRKLESMNSRVTVLEDWKTGLDIAKQAIEEYKKSEESNKSLSQRKEIFKQAGIVLGLIAAVLYVYLEAHGIHT